MKVRPDPICSYIFKKWIETLLNTEFKPKSTKFEFWIIYQGTDEFMKSDFIEESLNHLCFDCTTHEIYFEFLYCRNISDYEKYYESMKESCRLKKN